MTTFVTMLGFGLAVASLGNILQPRSISVSRLKVSSQKLSCYVRDEDRDSFNATDYIPDLDSKISSCNLSGIWILYDKENYEGSTSFWMYGYNYLVNLPTEFENKVGSLRFPGAPDDWKATSFNIYSQDFFMGEEEFAYEDIPKLNIKAKSVIITGCEPWTVYLENNYEGASRCLFPSDVENCTPGLYPTARSINEVIAGKLSSAKRGCQDEQQIINHHHQETVLDQASNGASGILQKAGNVP